MTQDLPCTIHGCTSSAQDQRRQGGECWGKRVNEIDGLPLHIISLAAGWPWRVVSTGLSTSRDRHSAYYMTTPGLPRPACIPSRRTHRNNMERPITPAPRWENPHLTLNSAFNHHRDVPTFYIVSKRSPVAIPLRREVPLLKPHFSLPRGENRLSEVSSDDLISTLSDPLQFMAKLQSEESALAHAFPWLYHFVDNLYIGYLNTTPIDTAVAASNHPWAHLFRIIYL